MTLKKALLAATVLALPMSAASAEPVTGLYLGAGVGANWRQNSTAGGGSSLSYENPGWVAVGSIGWGFGNGLRVEAEGNYRYNDGKNVTLNSAAVAANSRTLGSGSAETYGGMLNVLYDFNVGWPVVPYIGGGVGAGWNDYSGFRGSIRPNSTGLTTTYASDGGGNVQFAYQGIAGLAFEVSRGFALTLEYRYYGTQSAKYEVVRTSGPVVAGVPSSFRSGTGNNSLLIGIRYNFLPPPPPPPPAAAPAPAPARTYLVFFDWDRADLTDRARQIIAEAAQNYGVTQSTRVEVAGHADRSGSAAYNQRLSQRRADNVAAELVRRGVPRNAIVVTAYGETRPLVPTADGVREPQNRRVEIVLR